MEALIHYHKRLHVLTLLVLGLFAVGASAQGAEAKSRGKAPRGQDYLTSVTEANVEAVKPPQRPKRSPLPISASPDGPTARANRVERDAAFAVAWQNHADGFSNTSEPVFACCLPGDPFCDFPEDNQPPLDDGCVVTTLDDCHDRNGYPHEDVFDCEQACLNACCFAGGECDDNDGAGIDCPDCAALGGEWAVSQWYGDSLRCYDNPCPVCPWFSGMTGPDANYCIWDEQGDYMAYVDRSSAEPGEPYPRWADDFIAGDNGQINRICWWPGFYDPYTPQECYEDPVGGGVNDDLWQIVFYADNGGIPGAIVGGPELVTPDAKAPRGGIWRYWTYTAPLAVGPIVTQGECYWIEITGYGDPEGCQVYWLTNGAGNLHSLNDLDGTWGPEDVVSDVDLSFCVDIGMTGPCGPIPGACIVCGEGGPECSPTATDHHRCHDEGGVAFYPYMDCDSGYCSDDETWCSVSGQDCPAGLEPCTTIVPPPPVGSVCLDGPVDIHTGGGKDLCPSLPCTFDFDNTCAPTDGPDPECGDDFGSDIWFEFHAQAGECGNLYIDTCEGGTYDGIIAFYGTPCGVSGCPTDSAEMVSCGDDTCGVGGGMPYIGDPDPASPLVGTPEIYICQGQSYLIRMGGWGSEYGSGQMTISFVVDPLGCANPARPCIECVQAAVRPLAEDCRDVPPGTRCSVSDTCTVDNDCANESHCVAPPTDQPELDAVCYAPKTRYLSIARNPEQVDDTARRVNLDDGTVLGWVDEPYYAPPTSQHDGLWLAEIQGTPQYENQWPDVVHVTGCGIAHAGLCDVSGIHCNPDSCPGGETCVQHSYYIQAIGQGLDIADEDNYSELLELRTNSTWGDTVGPNRSPPDGVPGLPDIMAAIGLFQSEHVTPITWLDIAPSGGSDTPDQHVGLGDVLGCIEGYQGAQYQGDGPLGCP